MGLERVAFFADVLPLVLFLQGFGVLLRAFRLALGVLVVFEKVGGQRGVSPKAKLAHISLWMVLIQVFRVKIRPLLQRRTLSWHGWMVRNCLEILGLRDHQEVYLGIGRSCALLPGLFERVGLVKLWCLR